LLAPYVGMSLYSWTTIIAVVLAGLTIGHWIGGRAGQRAITGATTDEQFIGRSRRVIFTFLILAALASLATLFLLRLVSAWALPRFDPISAIGLITFACFFLPSLFVGGVSPVLTLIAIKSRADSGATIGHMYAMGAAGAIVGTLLTGLVFISLLGSTTTVLSIAVLYGLLALLFAGNILRRGVAVLVVLLVPSLSAGGLSGLSNPCHEESQYYCIRVDDLRFGPAAARVMALDHLGHGVNLRDFPRRFHSPYVQLIDELVFRRTGGNAFSGFLLGGGAYTLPRAWLAGDKAHRLVMAEIDPAVTNTAIDKLWFKPDERIRIIHQDARVALGREKGPFDIIVGDAFTDIGIPPHLVTREFHDLVKARLTPVGLYVINAVDRKRRPKFALSLAATLQQSFTYVTLWLPEAELGGSDSRTTWVIAASDKPFGANRLRARQGSDTSWRGISAGRLAKVFEDVKPVILTDDFTPVNRLLSGLLLSRELAE
ncbi:MAG: fused MFS/spermidine synthase, partial [Rhodospirillales bacterium]|nr:fused MFS/spermidine synthase [Rhodospirillales bacterium]